MVWRIDYTETARKQLKKLDRQVARRIVNYMDSRVTASPRELGKPLRGEMGELWRYRIGDTRVLCDIQDGVLVVLVVKLGHRKEVYS